jgi:hypothetical protein
MGHRACASVLDVAAEAGEWRAAEAADFRSVGLTVSLSSAGGLSGVAASDAAR